MITIAHSKKKRFVRKKMKEMASGDTFQDDGEIYYVAEHLKEGHAIHLLTGHRRTTFGMDNVYLMVDLEIQAHKVTEE